MYNPVVLPSPKVDVEDIDEKISQDYLQGFMEYTSNKYYSNIIEAREISDYAVFKSSPSTKVQHNSPDSQKVAQVSTSPDFMDVATFDMSFGETSNTFRVEPGIKRLHTKSIAHDYNFSVDTLPTIAKVSSIFVPKKQVLLYNNTSRNKSLKTHAKKRSTIQYMENGCYQQMYNPDWISAKSNRMTSKRSISSSTKPSTKRTSTQSPSMSIVHSKATPSVRRNRLYSARGSTNVLKQQPMCSSAQKNYNCKLFYSKVLEHNKLTFYSERIYQN